jgi:hypothetical protein
MVYSRFFAVLLQKSDWYHCKGAAAATAEDKKGRSRLAGTPLMNPTAKPAYFFFLSAL